LRIGKRKSKKSAPEPSARPFYPQRDFPGGGTTLEFGLPTRPALGSERE